MLDFFSKDPAKIIEKCNKLRLEGKYDKAEQILRKNIKNTPDDYLFLLELGRVQFEQDKLFESVASFKSAYYQKADAINNIIDVVEDIHFRSENKEYTGKLLIELYIKKKDSDNIHKIIKTISKEAVERINNDTKKKYLTIKKDRPASGLTKKDVDIFIMTGMLAIVTKDFETAENAFSAVFKNKPIERNFILQQYMEATQYNYSEPEPFMTIGDFYMIMGEKDKAINFFQRAIKLNPDLKDIVATKLDEIVSNTDNLSETGKFSAADVYVNKGDLAKAAMILSNLIDEGITDVDGVIKRLRNILAKTNNNIETTRILIKAVMVKKDFEQVIILLNRIFESDKMQTDYILGVITQIEENDFSLTDKDILKARVFTEIDKTEDAAKILKSIYDTDKDSAYDIEDTVNIILDKENQNITALTLLMSIFIDRAQLPKAKTLLSFTDSLEDEKFNEFSRYHYEILNEKYPDDLELKLPLAIAYIRKNNIEKASKLINSIITADPDLFYEIAPHLFEPSSSDTEIAKGILHILESVDHDSIDKYLYEFTIAEVAYLAGDVKQSLDRVLRLFEEYPDNEEQLMGIIDRMSQKYSDNQEIKEFEFKFYVNKKEYDKALTAVIALSSNKEVMGHVLDDLYLLHKHVPDNYDVMMNILKVLDDMGMYEKMISEAKTFVERVPQERSGLVRFYIGKSYAKRGQVNDAATYIFQAITLEDTIIEEAILILVDLLKIDYSSIKLHYSLAHAYQKNNDIDKAIDELMEIYRIDDKQIDIVLRDLDIFHDTVKSNPKLLFAIGQLKMKKIEYTEGVERLMESYRLDNSYMDPVLNLLKTMQETENIESGEILFTMGTLYADKGMYKMASDHLYNAMSIETSLKEQVINKLQVIINKQPEEIYARYSLTQVYSDMHNYIQAIQLLRQIETINPSESENIIEYYNSMLAIEPQNTSLLLSLGDSYLNTGNESAGMDIYSKAIAADKNLPDTVIEKLLDYDNKTLEVQFFLSDLYRDKSDYESSVNWLNSVYLTDINEQEKIKQKLNTILSQSPEQQNALMLLSNIYYNQEDYDSLIKLSFDIFEKSSVQEMKFRSGMLLSQAYRKISKQDKADDIISKMIKENRMLYYTVLIQFYEQEKSSRVFKLRKHLDSDPENQELIVEYAANLIAQNNFESAKNVLIFKSEIEEIEYERIYLLSKISEANNNLIFALQIATRLRYSSNMKHISYLIKLLMKMGYHGEIDSILKENPQYTVSMNKYNLSKHVFGEYKILT